jgi:hypothetical protein
VEYLLDFGLQAVQYLRLLVEVLSEELLLPTDGALDVRHL